MWKNLRWLWLHFYYEKSIKIDIQSKLIWKNEEKEYKLKKNPILWEAYILSSLV